MLRGYRGVVVHDRLAMCWKLKAKHGICGAHLLRDLAEVALTRKNGVPAIDALTRLFAGDPGMPPVPGT